MADKLRPQSWSDYIGQHKLKKRLSIEIRGANDRGERLEHILLSGPPGCGKTSLASLIAQKHNTNFDSILVGSVPINDIRTTLMWYTGVLFLDELHRMTPKQQEELLPVIEDKYVQLPSGDKYECEEVCVVAATTELDKIIPPLYDRFIIKPPFEEYSDRQMGKIVKGMASRAGVDVSRADAKSLARATGGIPRNAKQFINMARNLGRVDVDYILEVCQVTPDGLSAAHVGYLEALGKCGGTAGVEILSAHTKLPKGTLVDLEILLVKRNMIQYTKKGRTLMPAGIKLLKGNK